MATQRLPIPGGDNGDWGNILNGFLEVSLNADGTLKGSAAGATGPQGLTGATGPQGATGSVPGGTYVPTGEGVGDGATNNVPFIQANYDANKQTFLGEGTFLLENGGIFLDQSGGRSLPYVIEGTGVGTVLKLGSGLIPTASFYDNVAGTGRGDVTAPWAIFPNTPRTAVVTSTTATAWTATTAIIRGNVGRPVFSNGFVYGAIVGGTTGSSQPTWPTSIGNTVTDGTVTWECMGTGSALDCGNGVTQRNYAQILPDYPLLTLRNLVLDGGSQNAGFVFYNGGAVKLENISFQNWKFGVSGTGYTDGMSFKYVNGHSAYTGASNVNYSWLFYQIANGDGVSFDQVKMDTNANHHFAVNNFGSVQSGCVGGGSFFTNTDGVLIQGWHMETDETSVAVPSLRLSGSNVTVDKAHWQPGYTSQTNAYFAEIDDTSGAQSASILSLRDCSPMFLPGLSDQSRQPDVYILAANAATKVIMKSTNYSILGPSGSQTVPDSIIIGSPVGAIQTALTSGPLGGLPSISAGDCILHQVGGVWQFDVHEGLPGVRSYAPQATPTGLALSTTAFTGVSGTLTNGQNYDYTVWTIDDDGKVSAACTDVAIAATSAGAIQLTVNISAPLTSVVVARKAATSGVLTGPDHYCVIPVNAIALQFFDTGANLNGRPWQTTSIPTPPVVTTAMNPRMTPNVLNDSLILNGFVGQSIPFESVSTTVALANGTLYTATFVARGAQTSKLWFRLTTTGNIGSTGSGGAAIYLWNASGVNKAANITSAVDTALTTGSVQSISWTGGPIFLVYGAVYIVGLWIPTNWEGGTSAVSAVAAASGAGSTLLDANTTSPALRMGATASATPSTTLPGTISVGTAPAFGLS